MGPRQLVGRQDSAAQGSKPGSYSRTYAVGGAPAQPAAHADGPPRPLLLRGTAAAGLAALGAPGAATGDPGDPKQGPVPGSKARGGLGGRGGGRKRGGCAEPGRDRGRRKHDGASADAAAGGGQEELQARREAQVISRWLLGAASSQIEHELPHATQQRFCRSAFSTSQ